MVNVGSAISGPETDEDDGWDDDETYAAVLVTRGPYNAEPVDPARLPADRRQRLAALEDALMTAERTRSKSVAWSKARWMIETGTALQVLVDEDLYLEDDEYPTLETYATHRLHMSRGHVYELVADASRLLAIAPLSEISDKPFNASHARVLAPLMEPHADEGGKTKAEIVVADVDTSGRKRTAAALRRAAAKRGFTITEPAVPSARDADGGAVKRLRGLLKTQETVYDALGSGVLREALSSDPAATQALLKEFARCAARTDRRIRTALKAAEADDS
ncbi:hypothetical protein [Streptomyces sp. NPDC048516]|uniref:hypothetical protein n=1 Tax=Streptomyces sp. NPDC048516 TaxID=3365565 RepID=UPI00371B1C24